MIPRIYLKNVKVIYRPPNESRDMIKTHGFHWRKRYG